MQKFFYINILLNYKYKCNFLNLIVKIIFQNDINFKFIIILFIIFEYLIQANNIFLVLSSTIFLIYMSFHFHHEETILIYFQ